MAESSKETPASQDGVKYTLGFVFLVLGLFAWFWFAGPEQSAHLGNWSTTLRLVAVLAGIILAAVMLALTHKGKQVRDFLIESRFELRKVVWPSRQDATRTTWIVIVVVAILSVLLGGFDFVIQKLTQWFLTR